jgi:hypothetical protein
MALTETTSRSAWALSTGRLARVGTLCVVVGIATTLSACTSEQALDTTPSQIPGGTAAPVVAGTWTGTYRIVECEQQGGGPLANMCASLGQTFPFTLELEQQGRLVRGRYALANLWFDLEPAFMTDDRVTLQGTGRIDSAAVEVDVTWVLSVAPPALGGTAVLEWSADAGGTAVLQATLTGQPAS